ncbi:MAG: hypothetical protein R1F54_01665 [Candidatus Zeuxoniibacter abyssi]|nr:MAG: hypothetical protein R1F54_06305 [Candidatus Persebacteraceae bacterium AB1(2)]WOV91369.1 MAG: hypothetical protein R1F54_01510 [Candidatus Persebacteraceae bacterium AB1(2)]WOV91395.1 MAG: hypothetical protein R1F54_01665 [Candidatus Persebacteraceae bacterium AB1(2)]
MWGNVVGALIAVISGYMAVGKIPKKSEFSTATFTAWMQANEKYKKLYNRIMADDEIDQVEVITKTIGIRSVEILESTDEKIVNKAFEDANKILGCG